jgi:hypothetical protein
MEAFREEYRESVAGSPDARELSFPENESAFWQTVLGYLEGAPAGEAFAKLNAFTWPGMCGTGSQTFVSAKTLANFSILLADREYPAALGALIADPSVMGSAYRLGEDSSWVKPSQVKRVFANLHEPWEPVFLGLAGERNRAALDLLASEGGDVALRGLLELAPVYADNLGEYITALGGFLTPQCGPGKSKRENPVPAAAQALVLRRLNALAPTVAEADVRPPCSWRNSPFPGTGKYWPFTFPDSERSPHGRRFPSGSSST